MMASTDRLRDVNRCAEHAIAALRRLPHRGCLQTEHWFRLRVLALERAHHTWFAVSSDDDVNSSVAASVSPLVVSWALGLDSRNKRESASLTPNGGETARAREK